MPDLSHEPPGPDPGGWNPSATYLVVVDFDRSNSRKIIFRKTHHVEVPTPPDNQPLPEPTPTGSGEFLHHVEIQKDCYIQFWLSKNVDWHWHDEKAITTAKSLPTQYFKLQYLTSQGWDDKPLAGQPTRCVRLGAKYRGPGSPKADLFNMNVMLENPDGSTLPITIDPDIQNPRT
jgi:hypothetical protein